jgi:REP-associated tyrosine transposase
MRPTRLVDFGYTGCHEYFPTICTFERQKHFTSEGLVCDIRSEFLHTASELRFAISAYCFMPDHIHILAEGKAKSADLCVFVNIARQRSAFVARRWIRGRLWQAGYFDRVLREDDSTFAVAQYIVQNPVRAGLVRSPVEYPFCGSSIWSKEELVESTMCRPGAP